MRVVVSVPGQERVPVVGLLSPVSLKVQVMPPLGMVFDSKRVYSLPGSFVCGAMKNPKVVLVSVFIRNPFEGWWFES